MTGGQYSSPRVTLTRFGATRHLCELHLRWNVQVIEKLETRLIVRTQESSNSVVATTYSGVARDVECLSWIAYMYERIAFAKTLDEFLAKLPFFGRITLLQKEAWERLWCEFEPCDRMIIALASGEDTDLAHTLMDFEPEVVRIAFAATQEYPRLDLVGLCHEVSMLDLERASCAEIEAAIHAKGEVDVNVSSLLYSRVKPEKRSLVIMPAEA